MKTKFEYSKHVYIIGSGISAEVGAPLIKDFMEKLLHIVPPSKIKMLNEFLSIKYGTIEKAKKKNIERILSELDRSLIKGEPLSRFDIPTITKIRSQLINAIAYTLSKIHYNFLNEHHNYNSYEDPYYYHARDFRLLKRVKGETWKKKNDESVKQRVNRERMKLREARDLMGIRDIYWGKIKMIIEDQKVCGYLSQAALAAGINRFRLWYLRLHPLYPYILHNGNYSEDLDLKIKPKAWAKDTEKEFNKWTSGLLHEKCIKEENKRLIEEIRKILNRHTVSSSVAMEYYCDLFDNIYTDFSKNIYWIKDQAKYLLQGKIDPYPLLISKLRPLDTIITTNYDLFTEMSISSLFDMGINYGIEGEDLTNITPWGRYPFEPYSSGSNFITLLKLHGSINWLKCSICGHFYNTFNTPASMQSVKHILKEQDKLLRKEFSLGPCCYLFKPSETEIPLIPPTLKKSKEIGLIAKIWEKAVWEIASATELTFIGYSLSESDKYIRQLIKEAIEQRRRNASSYVLNQMIQQLKPKNEKKKGGDPFKVKKEIEKFLENVPKVTIICDKDESYKTRKRYEDFFSGFGITPTPVLRHASEYLSEEFLELNPDDIIYSF